MPPYSLLSRFGLRSSKTNVGQLKKTVNRNVWNVVLLGDPKVGKSTIVKQLLAKNKNIEIERTGRTSNMVEI